MEFEKKIKRLEEIVLKMERGELPLDQSLQLFEEGIQLSKECHNELASAELQVKKLIAVNSDGSVQTEDFREE